MNLQGLEVLQKIRDYGLKGSMSGATFALGSIVFFGQTGDIEIMGMNIPSYLPLGFVGAASSIAGDISHDYVLPHIPQTEKLKNIESAGLNFISSGGAFVGGLKLLTGLPNQNIGKAFLYGGAVKLGTDAVYDKYIESIVF